MEGEGASKEHADGEGIFDGTSVPMRRWEDWERSRLRKLKRADRRRKEMDRAYPRGFPADPMAAAAPGFLRPQTQFSDTSHWRESDTFSVVSSAEDDQWGTQIGAYNEHGPMYPPPPRALLTQSVIENADVLGKDEMEAMLERGWDDPEPTPPVPPLPQGFQQRSAPRFQLSDAARDNGYAQVGRDHVPPSPHQVTSLDSPTVTPNASSSAIGADYKTHVKRRSGSKTAHDGLGGRYGPMGPLDPGGSNRI